MRKLLILSAFAAVATFWSCKENCPVIPPLGPPEVGDRKVIVEEFTGNQCVNCPDGAAELENLHALYGDNLIIVSVHAGFFAEPTPGKSQLDFRTEDGNSLLNLLGEPVGYPSAVINRTKFSGESDYQLGQSKWSNYIASEINVAPDISIGLVRTYDPATRALQLNVSMVPQIDLSNRSLRYSVILTESNIVDYQLTGSGHVFDYNHKHALRDIITNATGDEITESATLGAAISRVVNYTVPDTYVAENCELVVIVTDANTKSVLQAEAIHLVE